MLPAKRIGKIEIGKKSSQPTLCSGGKRRLVKRYWKRRQMEGMLVMVVEEEKGRRGTRRNDAVEGR